MIRRLLALLIVVVAAGCTISTNDEPQIIATENVPPALLETTTSSTTSVPDAPTRLEPVYFLETIDGQVRLAEVDRAYPVDTGIAAVLDDLIDRGPDREGAEREDEAGLSTAIVEAELIRASLDEDSGVLVIDVRGLFGEEDARGPVQIQAAAQLVYTATADDQIVAVRFLNDGEPVGAPVPGAEIGPSQPVSRSDYSSLAPRAG